jgi:hypothetical protein
LPTLGASQSQEEIRKAFPAQEAQQRVFRREGFREMKTYPTSAHGPSSSKINSPLWDSPACYSAPRSSDRRNLRPALQKRTPVTLLATDSQRDAE